MDFHVVIRFEGLLAAFGRALKWPVFRVTFKMLLRLFTKFKCLIAAAFGKAQKWLVFTVTLYIGFVKSI
jgi:hypothetical protein